MTTEKLTNNKKRNHTDRVLQRVNKKPAPMTGPVNDNFIARPLENDVDNLKDQYAIIKKDLLKLRTDLAKGYDLAKVWMERKSNVRDLLRSR